MSRVLRESTVTIRTAFVHAADLRPYDVTWAGGVILSVDIAPNDAYRLVRVRHTPADGDSYISDLVWPEDCEIQILI